MDVSEKKYLMSRGVVTETQSNMGIIHTVHVSDSGICCM